MGIRRNKTFVEQATEAVESAYESARENLAPVIAEAMEMAEGAYEEAKEKAAPMVAEARDKAVPLVAAGAAAAAKGAAAAADLAAQKAAEGRDLAAAKAAELDAAGNGTGKKKHRLRTFILITGIAAALGFVVKKLTSGSGQDNWQSSYTPPPPPAAKASDTTIADAAAAASAEQGDDEGGASPDEAIADAVEEQHPVTTPDEPAEVVDLAPGEEAAEQSSRKP
jgi:hypothetical protein